MIFALVYTVVMIIAVVTVTRMVMALVMALVTKTTRPLLHLWHTRLKYMVFFIVLLVLVHLYLYAIDRYHPHMQFEDYEVALEVDEVGLYGKWIIKRPVYDGAYTKCLNVYMEGWKESELILKQDHTFTFVPIILFTPDFSVNDNYVFGSEITQRRRNEKNIELFRTRRNRVLYGKWELDYSESGQGIDHATIKQELIHSPNKYGVYLKLYIENPGYPEDQTLPEEFRQGLTVGRIYYSGNKGFVNRYVIGRTMRTRDYAPSMQCYYHRISKE